jgi:ComF family protein
MAGRRTRLRAIGKDLAEIGQAAFSLLVPPLCLVCSASLRSWERWVCGRCGLLLSMGARPQERTIDLGNGGALPVRFALEYTPPVSSLVHEMKYGGKPGVAEMLAGFLWVAAERICSGDAVLLPVPIHPAKRRERGYNQAEALSRHLGEIAGLSVDSRTLAKRRNTPSQTALERAARGTNVVGSIEACELSGLKDRPVILIDDVVTTGSTLRECAKVLSARGVEDISACTVASSF